jgi:outer membrane protein TolC
MLSVIAKAYSWICFGLFLFQVQGCTAYKPLPLDEGTIAKSLKLPDMEAIRIKAKELHHPILKPVEFDIRDGLSADEAAILAVIANPKLRAIRDQRHLADAQLLQAGVLPNPQLGYSLDFPTGGATEGTINAYNFSLNWEFTSLISRSAKINAAKADAASVDLDVAWEEWQTAEAAKLNVYHIYFFDQTLVLARAEEEGLKNNLDRVNRGATLGFMTRIDVAAADAAVRKMHGLVLTAEQHREQEQLALNQSLGIPAQENISLEKGIEPNAPENLPSGAELIDGIEERRLDLLALKSGYQAQEERLRGAVLAQFPKINIGFAHARDNTDVISSGFGITIDLPLFDRNQGAIAVEDATRTKLFDEYAARLFEARGEVARLIADMGALQKQVEAAQQSIPVLQDVVDSYRTALLQGNADVLTYYNARSDLTNKRLELLDLKRQLADMGVALEIAAGRYLEP